MKKKLIIFGNGKIADVLFYYFNSLPDIEVVAFTVDGEYIQQKSFNKLKVIPFENISQLYNPSEYFMFVAVGYQDLNDLRACKLSEARDKGYSILSYIGQGVPSDLVHGENCFVMDGAMIHPRVKIGENVFVWSNAIIGHHSSIGNNCWITSGVNIAGNVKVSDHCFFAINSTIGHSLEIGSRCFIGSNALVSKSLVDKSVIVEQSTKVFRLDSAQFLKLSKFTSL